MKSRTVASVQTNLFCVKLKSLSIRPWYVAKLTPKIRYHKLSIPKKELKKEFCINRIVFFKKHIWYHFVNYKFSGWMPLKFFRKNYCRLVVQSLAYPSNFNYYWAGVLMLYKYKKRPDNVDYLINSVLVSPKRSKANRPEDFFDFLVHYVGAFKNLSHKSARRLRDQIVHQNPVVMWVRNRHSLTRPIVMVGFNRRVFFYRDPVDSGNFHSITRQQLLKDWKRANCWGISC